MPNANPNVHRFPAAKMAAQTPPMGWRSWNLFQGNVNQTLMESIMRGVATKKRLDHTGDLVSLCDLGYCNVGLDDNWQACGSPKAAFGMHYHDALGNSLINEARFPNMRSMVNLAHDLNLTAGWYHNNCICRDQCHNGEDKDVCETQIRQDARAIVEIGFDAVKLDGCGGQLNLSQWEHYLNVHSRSLGKTIVTENCHWGQGPPPTREKGGCPYHFYRTSFDIYPTYKSMVHNLQTVENYHKKNLSFPGCWAYPDMLQVGVHSEEKPGLSTVETRSHFGAWAIVSSPLVLSHDVNNDKITDEIWDIISNREVLEVNQDYVGDSGGVFWQSEKIINLGVWDYLEDPSWHKYVLAPVTQLLSKPLSHSRVAVLAMNHGENRQTMTIQFENVPGVTCDPCLVRDVWAHQTIGTLSKQIKLHVDSHDSAFIVISSVLDLENHWFAILSYQVTTFSCLLILLWSCRLQARLGRWRKQLFGHMSE